MSAWAHVPPVWRFCGGRRHYNAVRRMAAVKRRRRVADMIIRGEALTGRALARRLGVSEATISRDVAFLDAAGLMRTMRNFAGLPGARVRINLSDDGRVTVEGSYEA